MRKPLFIARQGRHPSGILGQLVARIMARETSKDNETAIALLGVRRDDCVLDVGTGHGRALRRLAELVPQGNVTGLDGSQVMLSVARKHNRSLIETKRVSLVSACSDAIPLTSSSFDKIMAMHTIYFWNPAEPHLSEIARLLKPGGRLVLGFRPAEDRMLAERLPAPVYTLRATDEIEQLLGRAGLVVETRQRRDVAGNSMVWIAAKRMQ